MSGEGVDRRTCAQCGEVEPRAWVLALSPGRMFKIWKGASSPVDLCSFECSAKWHAARGRRMDG